MGLSPVQVQTIKATVPVVRKHGKEITSVFYERLLAEVPSLNNIFNKANQATGHQAGALAGALYAYAANIDDLGRLSPAVERICHKHASLNIQPSQYAIVGTYLLQAMQHVLESAFTPEIKESWAAAYWQLANIMIARETQLTEEAKDWKGWRDFVVTKKVKEAEYITSFYLAPKDGKTLPSYKPGQYISVQTEVPDLKYLQSRQYSLSGKPSTDCYRISVKREQGLAAGESTGPSHPGYISTILHREKDVGDIIQVSHPYGDFFLDTDKAIDHPLVLISAGVGVTPMLSILDTLVSMQHPSPISWIHATRNSRVQPFARHVNGIAQAHDNLKLCMFNKAPQESDIRGVDYHFKGRLDFSKLDLDLHLFVNDQTAEYYVCGPDSFMDAVERGLKDYGVGEDRIKLEVFGTGNIQSNGAA